VPNADLDNRLSYELRIVPRDEHAISRQDICNSALKVMYQLEKAGFEAYLVGGGVRDLLLGGKPKDFDVATNATPEQIKPLFRGARIIGRRFRIVHVRYGREIIEVTTFRGSHPESTNSNTPRRQDHSTCENTGMLLRDNVYGNVEDDAIRRDFTVNALYYTLNNFAIHDYCNGVEDLNNRVLRMIGDPEKRYREDPVRMLRAIRFAAKLDFTIAPGTASPIKPLAPLLAEIPAARLFDEVLKLFMAGHAKDTYHLLREYGLFEPLFPQTEPHLDNPLMQRLLLQAMQNTDDRIRSEKRVTPAFIYAALLWPAVYDQWQMLLSNGTPETPALQQAGHSVLHQQVGSTAIPKRFAIPMREIWDLQVQLTRKHLKKPERLVEHPRFRAAYDFLLLREQAGEALNDRGAWWTEFQTANPTARETLLNKEHQQRPRRRRRYPNKKKP